MTPRPRARRAFRIRALPALTLVCAALACGGDSAPVGPETPDPDPPTPPPPTEVTSFGFLAGHWETQGRAMDTAGVFQPTEGRASVDVSLTGQAREEIWVGTRGGVPAREAAFVVDSENAARHVIARAHGATGTLDVMEGRFTDSAITLSPRSGSRPDGGGIRERFSAITDTSFEWAAERFDGASQQWSLVAERSYRKISADPGLTWTGDPAPGCGGEAYRAFDFWLGGWNVGGVRSDIELILGGCVVKENWGGNVKGTSYNMYDPRAEQWTQVWTNANGGTLVLFGGVVDDGRMVLTGPQAGTLQRIEWTPASPDRVRQRGLASSDAGVTWTTLYDLTYDRR